MEKPRQTKLPMISQIPNIALPTTFVALYITNAAAPKNPTEINFSPTDAAQILSHPPTKNAITIIANMMYGAYFRSFILLIIKGVFYYYYLLINMVVKPKKP